MSVLALALAFKCLRLNRDRVQLGETGGRALRLTKRLFVEEVVFRQRYSQLVFGDV